MSELANERAKRAVWSKRMSERCKQKSERRSEWSSTLRVDFIVILHIVRCHAAASEHRCVLFFLLVDKEEIGGGVGVAEAQIELT